MMWVVYLLSQYWPLLTIILIFAALILILTHDRRPRP